jgi:hypothetical protein
MNFFSSIVVLSGIPCSVLLAEGGEAVTHRVQWGLVSVRVIDIQHTFARFLMCCVCMNERMLRAKAVQMRRGEHFTTLCPRPLQLLCPALAADEEMT